MHYATIVPAENRSQQQTISTLSGISCVLFTAIVVLFIIGFSSSGVVMARSTEAVALPKPAEAGEMSLEQSLSRRRSLREYGDAAIELAEISQLLWAAQGITDPQGYRTAPSADALYPPWNST
jgi:hypothetical protein